MTIQKLSQHMRRMDGGRRPMAGKVSAWKIATLHGKRAAAVVTLFGSVLAALPPGHDAYAFSLSAAIGPSAETAGPNAGATER